MPPSERELHRHAMEPQERTHPVRHRKASPSLWATMRAALRSVIFPARLHRAHESKGSHV